LKERIGCLQKLRFVIKSLKNVTNLNSRAWERRQSNRNRQQKGEWECCKSVSLISPASVCVHNMNKSSNLDVYIIPFIIFFSVFGCSRKKGRIFQLKEQTDSLLISFPSHTQFLLMYVCVCVCSTTAAVGRKDHYADRSFSFTFLPSNSDMIYYPRKKRKKAKRRATTMRIKALHHVPMLSFSLFHVSDVTLLKANGNEGCQ